MEKKPKVTHDKVKPKDRLGVPRDKYLKFLEMYHRLRPYLERELPSLSKNEFIKLYPKNKEIAEKVWICAYELKLKWPEEMVDSVFDT